MARAALMAERAREIPLTAADLNVAEQFVLWALRTRLEGSAKLDRLDQGFRLAQDRAGGGVALAAFERWFSVLARSCWRDLYLHRARCTCLSGDERTMLDLVATAQTGDEAGLDRIAAALVHPNAHESLLAASRRFAGALARLGLELPTRSGPAGRPASARLH
jgi:hypothetical protein